MVMYHISCHTQCVNRLLVFAETKIYEQLLQSIRPNYVLQNEPRREKTGFLHMRKHSA